MDELKLSIETLVPYPNHPFALYEGKRMDDLVESIREYGIILPIIVRPLGTDKYEIMSGHNRVEAAVRVGLTEVPSIIKNDISDDEAALIVTETNLMQRSFADLRYSERAIVLKNHLEALKKLGGQGKRNDLIDILGDDTYGQVAHKLSSREKVAKQYAFSEKTVRRYVRLAKLTKELLEMVDNEKLKFIPAVELSWLSTKEMNILNLVLSDDKISVSLKHAKKLREESENSKGELTKEQIVSILIEKSIKNRTEKFGLSIEVFERLSNYKFRSDEVISKIVSVYLDMLEQGEVKNVFDDTVEN